MAEEPRLEHASVEQRLADASSALGERFAGVDLTQPVMAKIAARPAARARRLRVMVATAALVAVALGVTLLVPSARSAVARWLGFKAVEVRFEEFPTELTLPGSTAPPGPLTTDVPPLAAELFGDPVTAAEAEQRTGLRVPVVGALGEPDAVYVDPRAAGGGGIIAVYAASPDLPDGTVPGVGAIVQVLRGHIDGPLFTKFADLDTVVETAVDGTPALFVGGGTHEIAYVDAAGDPVFETARLSGPTLLWDRDDQTLRLESNLPLSEAVALAETID